MRARQRTDFFCFAPERRPKESKQRKATPLPVSLRSAPGSLRCSRRTGSAQTRFAQTSAALFRPALCFSARAEGDEDRGRSRP